MARAMVRTDSEPSAARVGVRCVPRRPECGHSRARVRTAVRHISPRVGTKCVPRCGVLRHESSHRPDRVATKCVPGRAQVRIESGPSANRLEPRCGLRRILVRIVGCERPDRVQPCRALRRADAGLEWSSAISCTKVHTSTNSRHVGWAFLEEEGGCVAGSEMFGVGACRPPKSPVRPSC